MWDKGKAQPAAHLNFVGTSILSPSQCLIACRSSQASDAQHFLSRLDCHSSLLGELVQRALLRSAAHPVRP